MKEQTTRLTLDQIRKLKSLSVAKKAQNMTDAEIDKIIDEDPDLYHLSDDELAQFALVKESRNDKA